jgi:hypothetical protein
MPVDEVFSAGGSSENTKLVGGAEERENVRGE